MTPLLETFASGSARGEGLFGLSGLQSAGPFFVTLHALSTVSGVSGSGQIGIDSSNNITKSWGYTTTATYNIVVKMSPSGTTTNVLHVLNSSNQEEAPGQGYITTGGTFFNATFMGGTWVDNNNGGTTYPVVRAWRSIGGSASYYTGIDPNLGAGSQTYSQGFYTDSSLNIYMTDGIINTGTYGTYNQLTTLAIMKASSLGTIQAFGGTEFQWANNITITGSSSTTPSGSQNAIGYVNKNSNGNIDVVSNSLFYYNDTSVYGGYRGRTLISGGVSQSYAWNHYQINPSTGAVVFVKSQQPASNSNYALEYQGISSISDLNGNIILFSGTSGSTITASSYNLNTQTINWTISGSNGGTAVPDAVGNWYLGNWTPTGGTGNLTKVDKNGNIVWSNRIVGNTLSVKIDALAIDSLNNLIVSGIVNTSSSLQPASILLKLPISGSTGSGSWSLSPGDGYTRTITYTSANVSSTTSSLSALTTAAYTTATGSNVLLNQSNSILPTNYLPNGGNYGTIYTATSLPASVGAGTSFTGTNTSF